MLDTTRRPLRLRVLLAKLVTCRLPALLSARNVRRENTAEVLRLLVKSAVQGSTPRLRVPLNAPHAKLESTVLPPATSASFARAERPRFRATQGAQTALRESITEEHREPLPALTVKQAVTLKVLGRGEVVPLARRGNISLLLARRLATCVSRVNIATAGLQLA